MDWESVQEKKRYGVVKYNFEIDGECNNTHYLKAYLGQTLQIRYESQDWFYAEKKESGNQHGLIPKSYVEIIVPSRTPLVQEISDVLQEWYKLMKVHYLKGNPVFNQLQPRILSLLQLRQKIRSSNNWTVEQLRQIKIEVAETIDFGNNMLKLDMKVRDNFGDPLNTLVTSPIQLFREHKKTSERLEKAEIIQTLGSTSNEISRKYHSQSLLVTCERISWKPVDECEIRFFLWDFEKGEPFSEGAQTTIRTTTGFVPFRFIFTDLGKGDEERGKIYLVALLVRIGAMEYKEEKELKKDSMQFSQQIRRPWGVGAADITFLFRASDPSTPTLWKEEEPLTHMPFIPFEKDTLKGTLVKLISSLESPHVKGNVKASFFCTLMLIPGTPVNAKIHEDEPLPLRNNPVVARKIGFPDVILPNDTRNDLYVTMLGGDFHKGPNKKASDKNIEVTVSVHDESGEILNGSIFPGTGLDGLNIYRSVVYYHEDKPRWDETFKLSLPMDLDQFSTAHIKFTFRHRSSNETKDKEQKAFALAYVKLRMDKGTALPDGEHKLLVYKIDPKEYKEEDVHYLNLPFMLTGGHSSKSKRKRHGLSRSRKDHFTISTTLCSTQFTQNVHLLELLQWKTTLKNMAEKSNINLADPDSRKLLGEMILSTLGTTLNNIMEVSGDEIVKFLPHMFNALLAILEPIESIMNELSPVVVKAVNPALGGSSALISENCDKSVFECLIYIFGLILDLKYQNFKPVLDHYIEQEFSSTMAYTKLLRELEYSIAHPADLDKVLKILTSIEFFIKFIVRSFSIRISLRNLGINPTGDNDCKEEIEFQRKTEALFTAMGQLLSSTVDLGLEDDIRRDLLKAQAGILKHIPSVIEPLLTVFSGRKLSKLLVELIGRVEVGSLTPQKLTTIMEIVKSPLFSIPESRATLLPFVARNIKLYHLPGLGNDEKNKRHFEQNAKTSSNEKVQKVLDEKTVALAPLPDPIPSHSENTNKCVELMSELMDVMFRTELGLSQQDIDYIVRRLLRDIICSIGKIGENDPLAGNMVTITICLLRKITNEGFGKLMFTYSIRKQYKFLNDALVLFKNLFSKSFFPSTWSEMILLQNSVLLQILQQISQIIQSEFMYPEVNDVLWYNFFGCISSFLTQDSLQLENFNHIKRAGILAKYGDMRRQAGHIVHNIWTSLQDQRIRFVPHALGNFLNMAMVPEPELRKSIIPIFFDMMKASYLAYNSFQEIESELINRLVESVEAGNGDTEFRDIFYETMRENFLAEESELRSKGTAMVDIVTKLLNLLLDYKEVINEVDPGNRITSIVNLLEFSGEVDLKELHLYYVYQLHNIHIQNNNYIEAGFVLKLHGRHLDWSEEEVPVSLRSPKYPHLKIHSELKEKIYKEIINYFDDAKMWECAIEIFEELRQQYEELFNYSVLIQVHNKIGRLYEKILREARFEPHYFMVGFYGTGFPTFLHNKVYVYRARWSEQLNDVEARMLERFPHAELLRSLNKPSEEQRKSQSQYLQICKVTAVMKRSSGMKYAQQSIRNYYKSNDVNQFVYSRPYQKEPKDPKNEFASLWLERYTLDTDCSFPGIACWFPVTKENVLQIKPIESAIETIEDTNQKLRDLALSHYLNPALDLGSLSLKLNGVLDAAVMGGISNYEKAFFIPEYSEKNPDDINHIFTLKSLIIAQVPVIGECLRIHREKVPETLKPLHQRLKELYEEFLNHLKTYGMDINFHELKDEGLAKDMDRARKKRQASGEAQGGSVDSISGTSGMGPMRNKNSFPSTPSVNISGLSSSKKTGKSMVSIVQPPVLQPRSKSMSKLSSISGGTEPKRNDNESKAASMISLLLSPSGNAKPPIDNQVWKKKDEIKPPTFRSSLMDGSFIMSDSSKRDPQEESNDYPQNPPPLPPKLRKKYWSNNDEIGPQSSRSSLMDRSSMNSSSSESDPQEEYDDYPENAPLLPTKRRVKDWSKNDEIGPPGSTSSLMDPSSMNSGSSKSPPPLPPRLRLKESKDETLDKDMDRKKRQAFVGRDYSNQVTTGGSVDSSIRTSGMGLMRTKSSSTPSAYTSGLSSSKNTTGKSMVSIVQPRILQSGSTTHAPQWDDSRSNINQESSKSYLPQNPPPVPPRLREKAVNVSESHSDPAPELPPKRKKHVRN